MRAVCLLVLALSALPAWSTDIVDVLVRSQTQRMQQYHPVAANSERAARVRASFEWLVALVEPRRPVELVVVSGPLQAEAMLGKVIVASETLADLPEGERLLMLAHELGHLSLGHWDDLCALYRRHIPGEVRPETTDPVAGALGMEAHRQAHRHEFEADAFGYRTVHQLGYRLDTVMTLLGRSAAMHDTASHPGLRKRAAMLRQLDQEFQTERVQISASASWWRAAAVHE